MEKSIELMRLIRRKRGEKGLSQKELATSVGITQSYLSEIERGEKAPSLQLAVELAGELGIDTSPYIPDVAAEGLRLTSRQTSPWRQASTTLDLVKAASNLLQVTGINCLRPTHESREDMLRILNGGGRVDVCLLDIRSQAFWDRQAEECTNMQTGRTEYRLEAEFVGSMGILADIRNLAVMGKLDVRLYSSYPVAAVVIADDSLAEYNPYKKDKALWDTATTRLSRAS